MAEHVLITGGAGFIGSHLADALLRAGHRVRVFDNLDPQVHSNNRSRPRYLDGDVELLTGDVRDRQAVEHALRDVDAVVHFAAKVGVGQSMYRVEDYTSVNCVGTAALLEALSKRPIRRLVTASSMSIYGEGLYRRPDGRVVSGRNRTHDRLRQGEWELFDADGALLAPVPTDETKVPSLESVYALTKYDQERMCLVVGRAYGIPTVALRFFNVYGPRQALSNPYTGVLAIFASRLLNGNRPMIFEDGKQRRDFVSVHDVVKACTAALERNDPVGHAINVGSGRSFSVLEVASRVATAVGKSHIHPDVSGTYRMGDVRHCFADVTLARSVLGYEPSVAFESGLEELASWLEGQTSRDAVLQAREELAQRGLTL